MDKKIKAIFLLILILILFALFWFSFLGKKPSIETESSFLNISLENTTFYNVSSEDTTLYDSALTLEEYIELCFGSLYGEKELNRSCENNSFYLRGYTSRSSVNHSLNALDLYANNNEEYNARIQINSKKKTGLSIFLNQSMFLKDGEPDYEKLNETLLYITERIGGNYQEERQFIVKVYLRTVPCETHSNATCTQAVLIDKEDVFSSSIQDPRPSKEDVYSFVESCNSAFIDGLSDECFGYHYFGRGCYYNTKYKKCAIGSINYISDNYDLSYDEAKNLCLAIIHKGVAAKCLRQIARGSEPVDCLEYAGDDQYLIEICTLDGEINFSSRTMNDF